MRNRLHRPLLIVVFLIAVQVLCTFWSEVGGQYHLDLMFWPWKMGLILAAASLVTAITSATARAGTSLPQKVWFYVAMLAITIAVAGVVTYYYHVNEPDTGEQDSDQQAQPAAI